jgi:5-methylcytosine-specific restriction endonuclease McrA
MKTLEQNKESLYKAKANDSFQTKCNLFLYHSVVNDKFGFTGSDFEEFQITGDIITEYTTVYHQELENEEINGKKIKEIEKKIKELTESSVGQLKEFKDKYVFEKFPKIFPKEQFYKMLDIKKCCYCGITEALIEKLIIRRQIKKKSIRGFKLEVERFNSNLEYTPHNCSMCCYWCNNAKTDEFTASEFWLVGKIIGTIWDKRFRDSRENNDAEEGISLDELETIKDYQLKAYQKYSQSKSIDSSIKDQSEK